MGAFSVLFLLPIIVIIFILLPRRCNHIDYLECIVILEHVPDKYQKQLCECTRCKETMEVIINLRPDKPN